jgi:hypothetical protein
VVGRFIHADVSPDHNRHVIIPVNRVVSGAESVVLPPDVLAALVARASRHVTLNRGKVNPPASMEITDERDDR